MAGCLFSTSASLATYATLGTEPGRDWPGALAAATITDLLYSPPTVIALIGIPLVFPDGHLPSPRYDQVDSPPTFLSIWIREP